MQLTQSVLVLFLNPWYIDDGVNAGSNKAVSHTLNINQGLGPPLGLDMNLPKCEIFSHGDVTACPPQMEHLGHR